MRIEIMGANVTNAVADVLDTLQNFDATYRGYIDALDWAISSILLANEAVDEDNPRACWRSCNISLCCGATL